MTQPAAAPPSTDLLDQVEILKPLPAQLKAQLASRLIDKTIRAGTTIFNEGDPGDSMYLIAQGEVSVFLTDKALGLVCELARLGPGQAFGEMALVTGSPRSASVKATEDCTLRVLSRDILFKLVGAAPQVGLMIAAVLAKRTEELNRSQWVELGTLRGRHFDPALVDLLPPALVKKHRYAPIARGSGFVTLATPDPSNKMGLEDMRQLLGGDRVRVIAVPEAEFNVLIQNHFSGAPQKAAVRPSVAHLVQQLSFITPTPEREADVGGQASNRDATGVATSLIVEGIDRGASDIQIEPDRHATYVRFRVDGRMVAREEVVPRSLHAAVVSRLKVLASLNITERRLPQDGRISLELAGKGYDLRLATINTRYGEKVTMRVLDSSSIKQSLGSLILADKVAMVVRKLFQQPGGLVLVTGPTGSGKTTTLYAGLNERMGEALSICTVEDPVEYELSGVTQVQVDEAAGLGFAEILKAFLRQTPDVIFLGEMRDTATARLACNAALTGHLVLSSLHTNDAMSAIARLKGMGVESYLVAGSLLGVINQRLVRRICANCRVETNPDDATIASLTTAGVGGRDIVGKCFKGKGCAMCGGEGFKSRVGVYELLVMSQRVRDAIADGADAQTLRQAAMDGSYVPMARFGAYLLTNGMTTPEELLRILPRESQA